MTTTLVSLVISAVAAVVMALALRGVRDERRVRRGLLVGLPIIVLLTGWALWRDSFPSTFGPFVVISLLIGVAQRNGGRGGA